MRAFAGVSTLVALVLVAGGGVARADDDPNAPQPMTPVADQAAVCAALNDGLPVPAEPCKVVTRVKVDAHLDAVLFTLVDPTVARYQLVFMHAGRSEADAPADNQMLASKMVELDGDDCGMMKCDVLASRKPSLRLIKSRGMVALEIVGNYQHTQTNPENGKVTVEDRWTTYALTVCGASSHGPECVTRRLGGRSNACTGKIDDDGTVSTTCKAFERLDLY